MTNAPALMRMLITYLICVPAAILVGYLLTNPLDYGTIGFLGIVLLVVLSPVFIKWHYPIMVFGLACPMTVFFLIGHPSLSQVTVLLSLGIAIVERATSSERHFIRVPAMTWPLLFILGMGILTLKLTGGLHLHSVNGEQGGGRKYINLFVGVFTYFALTSRVIPREKWKWYLALFTLPSVFGMIGDMYPFLPRPLNLINLLFPPSDTGVDELIFGVTRFRAFSFAIGAVPYYLLARYGLRGVFLEGKFWRSFLWLVCFALSLLGGFRNTFFGMLTLCAMMFFMEGLHRTRLLPLLFLAGVLGVTLLGTFSDQLPYTFQRAMSFLPFKWKSNVIVDATASTEWRLNIWAAELPRVPKYLWLGKGYGLTEEDFDMIGRGEFANIRSSHIDASEDSLAVSNDFHSGPISALICFGIWGGIGIVWLMAACLFVMYRNYRYGPPELKVFNIFMLASCINSIFFFFFIFGAFDSDVGNFARMAGFSIAMNWGVAKRVAKPAVSGFAEPEKALPDSAPQPA